MFSYIDITSKWAKYYCFRQLLQVDTLLFYNGQGQTLGCYLLSSFDFHGRYLVCENGRRVKKSWYKTHWLYPIKEWVSFFLGSWGMNRSAGQTNRVNREAVLGRFVCSALRFIPHEPRKKDTHSLYLQCFKPRTLSKLLRENYKFKIPTVTGS